MYHKAFSTSGHLTNKMADGSVLNTGGIYTSLKMIQNLKKNYLLTGGRIYFLCDNTHSKENVRKDIDPEYKNNREPHQNETFYRGLDFLLLILQIYEDNNYIVKIESFEADDLVYPVLNKIPSDQTSLLVSTDMDWSRSISENVHWLKKDKIYDKKAFEEEYKFKPTRESVTLWKTFRGDSGDNIPIGVQGIRSNLLVQLLTEYSSLQDIFHNLKEIDYLNDSWKEKIKEAKPRLRLNYSLVDFVEIPKSDFENGLTKTTFRPNQLRKYYTMLGFNISKIDDRLMNSFPESNSFFTKQLMDRV